MCSRVIVRFSGCECFALCGQCGNVSVEKSVSPPKPVQVSSFIRNEHNILCFMCNSWIKINCDCFLLLSHATYCEPLRYYTAQHQEKVKSRTKKGSLAYLSLTECCSNRKGSENKHFMKQRIVHYLKNPSGTTFCFLFFLKNVRSKSFCIFAFFDLISVEENIFL